MKTTTRLIPWTLPYLSVFVAIASFASPESEAGTKQGYRFETRPFQHELFDYGRVQADQRDPSLPLTAEEEALLKGEGFDGLTIRDGAPYIEYSLKRIGLVRAIGLQKQEHSRPTGRLRACLKNSFKQMFGCTFVPRFRRNSAWRVIKAV